jgi:hypothetical protein
MGPKNDFWTLRSAWSKMVKNEKFSVVIIINISSMKKNSFYF